MKKTILAALLFVPACINVYAQEQDYGKKVTVTGSVQSDWQVAVGSQDAGSGLDAGDVRTNTYAEVALMSKHVDAGVRAEYLQHPLAGFEKDFKGWGVPFGYVKVHYNKWDLTAGSFYEQFGSGFILRTYEERSLGIDNHLRGGRLTLRPYKGIQMKVLSGMQRTYWDTSRSAISGADVELNIDQWSKRMSENGTYLTLGASYVNKYERDETLLVDATHRLRFPNFVNAMDFRANFQKNGFNVLAEYALKTQDPGYRNGYIYKKGNVAMLSAAYSKKGMSVLVQAKRSDNMSFNSERSLTYTNAGMVNHLPAFTMDHTYSLAALYPYATQPDGEWAFQGQFGYIFKKGTPLGGKYGTELKLNASYVRGLQRTLLDSPADNLSYGMAGTDGYTTKFFQMGGRYYQDFNVQIDKKINKQLKLNFMYMNQLYNKTVVEGEGGLIHSNILVGEAKYRFNKKYTLRGELQYLRTKDDQRDWGFALVELSLMPHWMFTVSDMWNWGSTNNHYYQASATYNYKSHRLQVGFGRTRAGFNCSGGVCRYVPETKGFTASYNYNF